MKGETTEQTHKLCFLPQSSPPSIQTAVKYVKQYNTETVCTVLLALGLRQNLSFIKLISEVDREGESSAGKYLSHKHENLSLTSKKPQKKARWGATHMQSQYLGSECRGMSVSLAKARSRLT